MKITLLGTSHGSPTATRNQSSALLEIDGHRYLIDAGEGTAASLIRQGVRWEEIDAVFITHMHLDHTGGLPSVLEMACKYRKNNPDLDPVVLLPDENSAGFLRGWMRCNSGKESMLTKISAYSSGLCFDDGTVKVEAFPTGHMVWCRASFSKASYGFRISAKDSSVFFTGDLTGDFSDFPFEAASGCDVLISELVHFSPEAAYDGIKGMDIGKLVFTHIGDRWQTAEGEAYIMELFSDAGFPVTVGYDGLVFETKTSGDER